jgi:hypothetical protein
VFAWLRKDLFQKPVNESFTSRGRWPSTSEKDGTYTVVVMNVGAHGSGRFNDPTFVRGVIDAASKAKVDKFI